MPKVLITGGAGFIGSYVVREFLAADAEVCIFDNFTTYRSPLLSHYEHAIQERFKDVRHRLTWERGDTRMRSDLQRVMSEFQPEIIIHLAALPMADLSQVHPDEAVSSILNGTANLLEVTRGMTSVRRVLYVSSSMVYGDFNIVPAPECHPLRPTNWYGGLKVAGEFLVQSYCSTFDVEWVIVRPSAVYGPTDINQRVSQIFIERALSGRSLVIYGAETQLDFTYVLDTARGIFLAATKPAAANQIFNITYGEGRALREYADILGSFIPGVSIELREAADQNRPKRGALDISDARALLGYNPQWPLEKGLPAYLQTVSSHWGGDPC